MELLSSQKSSFSIFPVLKGLNSVDVLISKGLINLNISHDELVSINNVLKEYDDMTEETKNFKT